MIEGDLGWTYWPPVSLNLEKIILGDPVAPLARFDTVSLSVDLYSLLVQSTVAVQGLRITGLYLSPAIDADGINNWEPEQTQPSSPAATSTDDTDTAVAESSFKLDIDSINLNDIQLEYRDGLTDSHYSLTIPSFTTGRIRYGEPVDIRTTFLAVDAGDGSRAEGTLRTSVTFDSALTTFRFSELQVSPKLTLPDQKPQSFTLSFDGELKLEQDYSRLDLSGQFDKSNVTGWLAADERSARVKLAFDLVISSLDMDEYAEATPVETGSSGGTPPTDQVSTLPQTPDDEIIPLFFLREYDIQGRSRIGQLHYDGYQFANALINTVNQDGRLQAGVEMQGYGGTLNLQLISLWKKAPGNTLTITIKQLDLTELAGIEAVTGHLSQTSKLTFKGSKISDVSRSLDGTSTFSVIDGTLDVRPIKNIAATIDSLRGKQSRVAVWPDRMPFNELRGEHHFNQGTLTQAMSFAVEHLSGTGTGGFDYLDNRLNYDFRINLGENVDSDFKVGPALANIRWPLHCEGAMDAGIATLCRPDKKGIQTLVTDVAKQELKRKGEKELNKLIEEKVPEQLKDVLKGLFK